MTRSGWRQGLDYLARKVTRVLLVYALLLQVLAPLAVAQAEARGSLEAHPVLCSAMAGAGAEQPAQTPVRVVHDCLSCSLGSVVGVLPTLAELQEPAIFALLLASHAPRVLVLPARAGSPPPQRAPPGLV